MIAAADSPEVLERFEAHVELVERIASQVARGLAAAVDRDELLAAGREGLLDAARRFEPDRGVPFGAYATLRIRGSMIDGVRRLAALPRRAWDRLRAIEAAHHYSEGSAEDAFAPRPPGASAAQAEAALDGHLASMATAIAMGLLVGADATTDDVGSHENPEDALLRAEMTQRVRDATDALPEPEGTLVRRHYFAGERLDHVAADLGLSKSWASRLHTRAVRRLARRLGAKGP